MNTQDYGKCKLYLQKYLLYKVWNVFCIMNYYSVQLMHTAIRITVLSKYNTSNAFQH